MNSGSILHGDARNVLADLPDGSVQLSAFSPPYNLGKNYGSGDDDRKPINEWKDLMSDVFDELFRVTRPDGKVAVNIGNSHADTEAEGRFFQHPLQAFIIQMGLDVGFDFYDEIIWKKNAFANKGGGPLFGSYPYPTNFMVNQNHEHIVVFRKWVSEDYYSGREIPELGTPEREESELTKEEWREYTNSIWEIQGVRQSDLDVDHNAVFPLEIPKRLVKLYSFVGDTVLDPFIGTGTTAVAASQCDRAYVGIDQNKEYVEYARDRIEEVPA